MLISKQLFHGLIAFTIFFPYIPSLFIGLDVQPFLVFSATIFIILLSLSTNYLSHKELEINYSIVLTIAFIITWTSICLFINLNLGPYLSRFLAVIIFFMYVLIGAMEINFMNRRMVVSFLLIYLFFTIIYFLTGGALEEILIRSRSSNQFESAILSGRGSSALSPEPSFFAHQVFIIFIFSKIFLWERISALQKNLIYYLSIFLLGTSFSVTGFIYIIIASFTFFKPKDLTLIIIILGLMSLILFPRVEFLNIRVFIFAMEVFQSISSGSIQLGDISFLVRIESFLSYIEEFKKFPIFGNGFRAYLGGGLISIVAELGIVGLIFLIGLMALILTSSLNLQDRLGVLGWLMINTISGSIANPGIGIFIGMLWAKSLKQRSKYA